MPYCSYAIIAVVLCSCGIKSGRADWIKASNTCKGASLSCSHAFIRITLCLMPVCGGEWRRLLVCCSNDDTFLCKDVIMSSCSHITKGNTQQAEIIVEEEDGWWKVVAACHLPLSFFLYHVILIFVSFESMSLPLWCLHFKQLCSFHPGLNYRAWWPWKWPGPGP